jgi:hypothetical protein
MRRISRVGKGGGGVAVLARLCFPPTGSGLWPARRQALPTRSFDALLNPLPYPPPQAGEGKEGLG